LPDSLFSHQKCPICLNFGVPWNEKCWYIYVMDIRNNFRPFGNFMAILWSFGIYFTVFVCSAKKIWQPCLQVLSVGQLIRSANKTCLKPFKN
jgi:hypothetical protein